MAGSCRAEQRRGFTLVEILVVMAIIAILLTLAIPSFTRARSVAWAKSCQKNLKHIAIAKEQWAMPRNEPATAEPTFANLVGPSRYLKNTPACPAGGTYSINDMNTMPTCTVGGERGDLLAHVIP